MRTRPITLSKTCPYCGARARAEAKLPVPANGPAVDFNLDNLAALVEKQSLSLLLALVELLPYKTFACLKCGQEFRLESHSARELVGTMLGSLQPVPRRPAPNVGADLKRRAKPSAVPGAPRPKPARAAKDWEAESLDGLFDYSTDDKPKG